MSLRVQLLLLQLAIVLVTVLGTGIVASALQEQQLRDAYRDRMIGVAQSAASLPAIVDAFDDADPSATIQPIAELLRKASDVTYVVVTNAEGIRYSHPDPDRIGEHVSTDPSLPLSGKTYVGTQTGTLGASWRVKVPIFNHGGAVMGLVSVGILESDLRSDYLGNSTLLFLTIAIAAVLGVIGAAGVTSLIRRRIYGLEPEQIAGLLEEREAILHGVREGVVAVDDRGHVTLINDAAARLLGMDDSAGLIGRPAAEVLDADLVQVLADVEAEQRLVLSGERVLVVRRDSAEIDGSTIGAILILRDNTELHTLLRDLDGAQGLADGLRSQAHGFANKLHVISGLLELGHVDEAVAFIAHEGSGGTLADVTGSTGIRDLEVGALLLVKQAHAKELGIIVSIDPESQLPALGTDPVSERLRDDLLTVLGNLLDNSVEACAYGGHVSVSVAEATAPAGGSEVTVTVEDDGVGIPAELRDRVFTAGFSSKATLPGQLSTGRGIGLTLVKRIAQRHGGSVEIDSDRNAGNGARIVVRVPAGRQL
ncbi:sensor histidine kinase [Cryobacterium tepidiphilum]|uniref:histidine kinase n=2 Tax=Cryobacterium tepidiphilum TaxID=2486026 RepID=A0A3M8LQT3_9MICO|nr:sensor histidine kinase [Cryobacterium tepidiphilum]